MARFSDLAGLQASVKVGITVWVLAATVIR